MNDNIEFVKADTARKIYKISHSTLRLWRKNDRIKYQKLPSNRFLYAVPSSKIDDYGIPSAALFNHYTYNIQNQSQSTGRKVFVLLPHLIFH